MLKPEGDQLACGQYLVDRMDLRLLRHAFLLVFRVGARIRPLTTQSPARSHPKTFWGRCLKKALLNSAFHQSSLWGSRFPKRFVIEYGPSPRLSRGPADQSKKRWFESLDGQPGQRSSMLRARPES